MRPWQRIPNDFDHDSDPEPPESEQSPLLSTFTNKPVPSRRPRPPSSSWLSGAETSHATPADPDCPSRTGAVFVATLAASLLILTIDVVATVPMTPRLVLFEDIICRQYYSSILGTDLGASGAPDCKIEPVQSELAIINGWKETFDTIPGVLVSIPYGALANYIGRPNVLKLALLGTLLSECWIAIVCWLPQTIPLRAIWISGVFQLIGGGGATAISMCYTMIAELCTPQQLTTTFSQVHAAILLSEMMSIPLGSALASLDPWIPILGSLAVLAAALLLVALLSGRCFTKPTTASSSARSSPSPLKRHRRHRRHRSISPLAIDPDPEDARIIPRPDASATRFPSSVLRRLRRRLSRAAHDSAIGRLWLSPSILLMFVAFFCCQLSRQFSSVLLQFSSFKFHWDYAKASYLLPLRAAINLAVLFVLIPRILHHLTRERGLLPWQADKAITLLSGTCLVLGSLVIFLASRASLLVLGQAVVGLGFAFTVTGRSFLTAMVEPRYTSLLFTSVTAVTYAGLIVGGPVFAGAFRWGLQIGGVWIGMPFLIAAVLFAVATVATAAATVAVKSDDDLSEATVMSSSS